MKPIECMGVLAHPLRPQTSPVAAYIAETLEDHGLKTWAYTNWTEDEVRDDVPCTDMVVAIGGDGAMLRAARVCAAHEVPVLGVNMGQLGFLTEVDGQEQWESQLERVLAGDYWIERRMMLSASVLRDDEVIARGEALNDIVVSGSIIGRMIQLETYIDGNWTTTYSADALIVATPTGSTAYALAVGGPILPPELLNILVVPAAPHLSMDRPLVLSEGATVEIIASSTNRSEILLTVDGAVLRKLHNHERVRIQASDHFSRFVRLRERNYFYRSLLDRLEPRLPNALAERQDKL